jgi:hypothetical protein
MHRGKFFCRYQSGALCSHLYCGRPLNARVKASVPAPPSPVDQLYPFGLEPIKPKGGA